MANFLDKFNLTVRDGKVTLVKEPVRPRCWLDWENTEPYEDEEEDEEREGIDCWLRGE